jgi:hypothetical protein
VKQFAALLTALFVLLLPVPARADPPSRLADQVTVAAGVLGDWAEVETALSTLQRDTGIQLFVVVVDSFDGTPAQQWTDETARLSDLGDRDALLAVATGDRAYAYSFPEDSRFTDKELADVAARDIEPALGRGDWSGAVIAGAAGYADAAGSTGSGGAGLGWAVAVVALVIVAALVWVFLRRRRRSAAAPAAPGPNVEELSTRANALLIELDNDLRASERELDLATAQYGASATAPFRAALEASRQDVAEAFRLRMTLDETPAPAPVLSRIIELCEAADARLDAESEAFDRLRDLESRAVEVADELDRRRTTIEAGLGAAEATVRKLTARWSGAAVTAIGTNVDQVRERLAYAAAELAEARSASSPAQAALAVRDAEQAVDQAEHLRAAIDQAATDLPAARTTADALVAEVTGDLAAGRAVLAASAGPAAPAGLAAAVAAAEQTLEQVRALLGGDRPDPLDAVARLQAADAALDTALAAARDAAERTARAQSLLAQALPVARAEVAAANSFITTRRGAVDSGARTYLSEAQRHLALAESLAVSDPATALLEAQQARQLAATGGQAARADVQGWGGGGFDSGAFAGAVLGGLLAGGRSYGGGFGGSAARGRRSSGGGGGRRGGGGRF